MSSLAKKFQVTIHEPWCKGCGLWSALGPKKVLELNDRVKCEAVRVEDCIGCRQCDNICPDLAVTVKEREENA